MIEDEQTHVRNILMGERTDANKYRGGEWTFYLVQPFCTMLISMKIVNIDTRKIYTILHITDDSIVPVLCNKALNSDLHFLKEGL